MIRVMKIITDEKKIDEILTRGVHEVFTTEELKKRLLSGKQLHLKLGTDVTGKELHLGHAVVHRKIRDFQELGHRVTLIIGDFTTLVGDHSDKVDMREEANEKNIKEFQKTYASQFFRTVIKRGTKIRHNSEWLKKLNLKDVINLTRLFTFAQMLDRETFKLRYNTGKTIELDEFLYPLMQGYDSVAIKADLEFGGTDQTFNLLAGRKVMSHFGLSPQCALVTKLLVGSDGKPMGKSLKNFIPITDPANEMYGKIMTIVDEVIFDYFELVTRVPLSKIEEMKKRVREGANPMEFKKRLAREIVSFYHGEGKAKSAEENFEETFQKGEIPGEMAEVEMKGGERLMDVLVRAKVVSSKSDFRRLVREKAVINLETSEKITDPNFIPGRGMKFRIGKRRFVKIF